MNTTPPPFFRWLIVLMMLSAAVVLAVMLPASGLSVEVTLAILAAVELLIWVLARRADLDPLDLLRHDAPAPPPLFGDSTPPRRQIAAEIALVIVLALFAARNFTDLSTATSLVGLESEWLTSSVYLAHITLRDHGYMPLWNPYFESGEPLIHNPFAFILNPFSSAPSLIFGAIPGLKISVILTAVIAAGGGWFLGRVMGFGAAGRLLLAALVLGKGNMHAMIGTGYYQLGVSQAYFGWIIGGALVLLRRDQPPRWAYVLTALSFALMYYAGNLWYTLPMLLSLCALTTFQMIRAPHRRTTSTDSINVVSTKASIGTPFMASVNTSNIQVVHLNRPEYRRRDEPPRWMRFIRWIDAAPLRRISAAGLLTIALSAATLLPLWSERHLIGDHPDLVAGGYDFGAARALMAHFAPFDQWIIQRIYDREGPLMANQFYYSYVAPWWFAALLVITLPLHRPGMSAAWRVIIPALLLFVLCLLWGSGDSPLWLWLYEHVPGLGQWRFPGRALAVSSFWLAVLLGWRFDALFRALPLTPKAGLRPAPTEADDDHAGKGRSVDVKEGDSVNARDKKGRSNESHPSTNDVVVGAGLRPALAEADDDHAGKGRSVDAGDRKGRSVERPYRNSFAAALQVKRSLYLCVKILMLFLAIITVATAITEWHRLAGVQIMAEKLPQENACIDWLRARYPDRPLAMWRVNYDLTNHFLENDMRLSNIAADFSLIALPDTIDAPDLVYAAIQAEYASPIMPEERPTLLEEGYQPVTESPPLSDGLPCLYQRETLPYAYSVPLWTLERTFNRLDPILTAPVLVQARAPGRVHLLAAALTDRETVVTAQERAMPGWWAWVDGQPAPLHIAGGQIAVMLPNDGFAHEIVFVYYPPLLAVGGLITLAACVGCMIYLLRGIQARYEISKLS